MKTLGLSRKRFVATTLLGAAVAPVSITASSRVSAAVAPALAVYLHCRTKPWALNRALTKHLPGVTVTVYGRFSDFSAGLRQATVALAIRPVIAHYGLTITLAGTRSGRTEESYSLVGIETPPAPSRLESLGVVDLLGRSATASFVESLVGPTNARTRRVTKVEDLLPLLLFKYVDAILAPTHLLREFQAKTDVALKARRLSKPVGLPTVAALRSGSDSIVRRIQAFDSDVNNMLEVEAWR